MNIVVIGAGRLGSALSVALNGSGHNILKIISRTGEKAAALAETIGCDHGSKLIIPPQSEVLIVAVNDDALPEVLSGMTVPVNTVVAHTAGSVGLDVFGSKFLYHGVFYPLQTFTHGRKYDFSVIPVFTEGNTDQSKDILSSLAGTVSNNVFELDSEKRRYLHLAAVFSCNFVNHMYYAGKVISARAGMDFDVLLPLLKETLEKVADMGPEKSQTGPAVRNDKKTIEKHLDLLSFSPDLQEIYILISRSIINKYIG
ncbi:MAG: DUF2520 domain-containing protein [Bacteroidales bacterium]|nr:DUF2520 domain-containing protein [Bacteroidales bacterium]